jgi:L-galactonate dehydratase
MVPQPTIQVSNIEILDFTVTDLRFPTSLDGVGSDAMHVGTNGSHPYIRLQTNHLGLVGEGIVSFARASSASFKE